MIALEEDQERNKSETTLPQLLTYGLFWDYGLSYSWCITKKLKTKKKMFSGKKQLYFQVKVNEEENKNKITLEDVLNNEEDFLLAMKEQ